LSTFPSQTIYYQNHDELASSENWVAHGSNYFVQQERSDLQNENISFSPSTLFENTVEEKGSEKNATLTRRATKRTDSNSRNDGVTLEVFEKSLPSRRSPNEGAFSPLRMEAQMERTAVVGERTIGDFSTPNSPEFDSAFLNTRCTFCKTTDTAEWHSGLNGRAICSKCWLVFKNSLLEEEGISSTTQSNKEVPPPPAKKRCLATSQTPEDSSYESDSEDYVNDPSYEEHVNSVALKTIGNKRGRNQADDTSNEKVSKDASVVKQATVRKRGRKPIDKSQFFCRQCNTRETPEWRKGPLGKNTLCNACGLKYAKSLKRATQERRDMLKNISSDNSLGSGNSICHAVDERIEPKFPWEKN
jgi:hypothetical protein